MKLALRYIPTEVWVDVICYPWITRKRLGKIVDKFRNRYFAEILQYYLHDRGKRTLGNLQLKEDGIYKCLECEPSADAEKLDVVQTPMPENIKFFERIAINHFDTSTLSFLRQISTLFTNDVNLSFTGTNYDLANLRTMLDHLSPLLHGIHSMKFMQSAIPLVQQYFGPKLAKVKMLSILIDLQAPIQESINYCLNWLTSEERGSAEPKLLKVYFCSKIFEQFIVDIQQQFLSAKRQSTFAIGLVFCWRTNSAANFHLENSLGEQLDGQFQFDGCSSGIEIFPTMTIGQIDADASAHEVIDIGEEAEDQPSTSKKPKLA